MTPEVNKIYQGDCIELMRSWPDEFVQTCVTSPPYWGLRDYGVEGQLGLEEKPELYVERMVEVFREVKRVLREDGTLWLNIGDSYAGSGKGPEGNLSVGEDFRHLERKTKPYRSEEIKPKDLVGIPWMLAFALRADGWYLRSEIIWAKKNCMPESVTDRPSKAHETIFLLAKSDRYFYDIDAIREPHAEVSLARVKKAFHASKVEGRAVNSREDGDMTDFCHPNGRNKRTVWHVASSPFKDAHFATFPEDLIKPCVLAGAPPLGIVLDPFMGAGTTAFVASSLNRRFIGCELNPAYVKIAERRIASEVAQGKFF